MIFVNKEYLFELRGKFFEFVGLCYQTLAKPFGFPKIKGMPLIQLQDTYWWTREESPVDELQLRRVPFPPSPYMSRPDKFWEVIFGTKPFPLETPRMYYETPENGYYSYYIESYKNLRFLPNWLSEFLQIKCHICTDISILELARESVFAALAIYFYMCMIRISLGWFVSINPYIFPIAYFIALIDWVDEIATAIAPSFGGLGLGTPVLFFIIGKVADFLNNLVFTMPYLPDERNYEKTFINGQLKDVLVFRDLPYLWYKYPIPNEIRTFWFLNRPDILRNMEKLYGHLHINFQPDFTEPSSKIDSISSILNNIINWVVQ